MKRLTKFAATLAASGCVSANSPPNSHYQLSASEVAVVQRSVAAQTFVPDQARFEGISASITPDGVVMSCGHVIAVEPSGFYGLPRAFVGVLRENAAGALGFSMASGIAQTSTQQRAIEQLCSSEGMAIGSDGSKTSEENVREMITKERELNSRCRGTEGANPESTVCSERDAVGRKLNVAGWCYGREGEFGYQNEWHVCQADSIRLKG